MIPRPRPRAAAAPAPIARRAVAAGRPKAGPSIARSGPRCSICFAACAGSMSARRATDGRSAWRSADCSWTRRSARKFSGTRTHWRAAARAMLSREPRSARSRRMVRRRGAGHLGRAAGLNMTSAPMITKPEPRRAGVPLRPDWSAYQPPPFVARAAVGAVRAALADVVEQLWPGDRVSPLTLRSASAPATTGSAAVLGRQILRKLPQLPCQPWRCRPAFCRCAESALGSNSSVALPTRAAALSDTDAAWVDEASPSPVKQYTTAAGVVLGPMKKLVSTTSVSRELSEATDVESILSIRFCGRPFLIFSTPACSRTRPLPRRARLEFWSAFLRCPQRRRALPTRS